MSIRMSSALAYTLLLVLLTSMVGATARASEHLQFFGFAVVDCGWDDPFDRCHITTYTEEIAGFSNAGQMCVYDPGEAIGGRLDLMAGQGVRAIIDVSNIFFVSTKRTAPSGGRALSLRINYLSRWKQFVTLNDSVLDNSHVLAFYLADEPFWNGMTATALTTAANTVKASFPQIPAMFIEAYAAVDQMQVPTTVDWFGFDRYGVLDPGADPAFLADLATVKSKQSAPHQRLVMVMETQWLEEYALYGVQPADMAEVARRYYDLAVSDPDFVGIVGYLWPGGLDGPGHHGARQLPAQVRSIYQTMGSHIIQNSKPR